MQEIIEVLKMLLLININIVLILFIIAGLKK